MHNQKMKKTGMYFITRATKRSGLKARIKDMHKNDVPDESTNRAMRRKMQQKQARRIWADAQIKKLGKKAYVAMRYATDPRGRHSLSEMMG